MDSNDPPPEGVLLRPAPTDAYRGAAYARAIRLRHSGPANGRLLATCEYFQARSFPIFESLDDGRTWSAGPVAHVRDAMHGEPWSLQWQPNLFELPRPMGDLPAGTILLAGNAITDPALDDDLDAAAFELQVYASADLGRTWTYRSTLAASPVGGGGVWEPHLQVAADGSLVAYYSDETHKAEGYNQLLGHKVSTDGGRTWGEEVYDVALPGGVRRPGMAVVERLPDGRYVMSHELVVFGEPTTAPVYVKFSRDGLDWGDPADPGVLVRSGGGAHLESTPFLAWAPSGGPDGTLVLSAMHVVGSTPSRKLLLNRSAGRGPWEEMEAPVQFRAGNDHAGWSQGLLPTEDGRGILHLAPSDIGGGLNEIRYAASRLPEHAGAAAVETAGAAAPTR